MPFFDHLKNRKIIILTTTTQGWTEEEIAVNNLCNHQAKTDITRAGFKCQVVEISTVKDMIKKLAKMDRDKVVIVNWVEEIEGLKYGYHIAPEILDRLGFIYTGNDSDTLVDTYDKIKTKTLLKKNNVSTPRYAVFDLNTTVFSHWNTYPCILKPANEHCSYGITRHSVVDNETQLKARANTLFKRFKQPLLVEEFIDGPEYFVSTWGHDSGEFLPPVCQDYSYATDFHNRIYDYVAKWKSKTKVYKLCTNRPVLEDNRLLPPDIFNQVSRAIKSVGCKSYCRVDVRVRDGTPYILDINANPDIVTDSDFILASSKQGYNYGETLLKLCDLAVKDSPQITVETKKLAETKLPHPLSAFATIST